MLKLKELMTSTNVKEIKYLGLYAEKAFEVRNDFYTNQIVIFLSIQFSVCVFSRSHQYIFICFVDH